MFFSELMPIDSFTQMSKSRVFIGLNMYCNYGNIIDQNLHVVSHNIYLLLLGLFDLILYVPVNNCSVMSGRVFLG